MEKREVTGRLEQWAFDGVCLYGSIFDDIRGRFADGTEVRTSRVKSPKGIQEGDIVETLNSRYLLGKKA